jgi:hypothetical protein
MRLYYISFFYFNIVLFIFFILKIDLFFLIFLFFRKTYSIFKESLTEYNFQEFDGLTIEGQILDLYENKLYVDFGLDAGLEEFYLHNLYIQYAFFDISLDYEAYTGFFTFKWNDFNVEELNFKKESKINFKKIYLDLYNVDNYFFKNIKEKIIDRTIHDDDYMHLYNYKNMNKREVEEPSFYEENEKFYYNYLKIFFLKENFYDTFILDNYFKSLNYNNFIINLKKKVFFNKYNKKKKENFFLKNDILMLNMDSNITELKKEFLDNNFIKK